MMKSSSNKNNKEIRAWTEQDGECSSAVKVYSQNIG